MQDAERLKRHLESMEKQLYRIHCQRDDLASPSRATQGSGRVVPAAQHARDRGTKPMPALTRDQFMAMQPRAYPPPLCESPPHPRPPALEDSPQWGYLSELISQPHSRKPSRCVTRQTSMDDTETMTDFGGRPNRLAPMPHYSTSPRSYKKNRLPKPISPISQIDCCEDPCSGESESEQGYDGRPPMINDVKLLTAFEKQLQNERAQWQLELDSAVMRAQQDKENMRRKLDQEREKFYAREEELQRLVADHQLESRRSNDQLRRIQMELNAQHLKSDEAARDNERLQRELHRVECKAAKLQEKVTDLQASVNEMRAETLDAKAKLADAERDLRKSVRDLSVYTNKAQELQNQVMGLTETNEQLKLEQTELREENRRLTANLESLQQQRDHDTSTEMELKEKLERLAQEKATLELTKKRLEERALEIEDRYKKEKAEREKAQRISLDLSTRHAESVKYRTKAEELAAENDALVEELRSLKNHNERYSDRVAQLERQLAVMENGKSTLEQEIQKLKKELNLSRLGARATKPSCRRAEDVDLIDIDCNPLSRKGYVGKDGGPQTRRPFWWHEETQSDKSAPPASLLAGPRSAPIHGQRRQEFDFVRRVTPVPRHRATQSEDSRLELLRAERNEVEELMRKIPKNPAFRTSEEAEEYSKLQKRYECIDQDIEKISIAL
eukprot:Blabericola_migrator_1__4715@NODE_248_length_10892_cov_157_608222_g209_i0_p3_GENE_NODE_248_length_10892_cov_157_608222_g209_i0NODE_248_length_10892_cov_157_608222_g209_i0_p3_ORF_typecomplete_len674_score143_17HOOK/PF05622_12/3_1e02HOOK/PF05622_12/7_4e08HOOK/PF05622_12/1_5e03Golgin_A5/PF09787_9/2_4e03Golgin_A5/PF09787_9/8_8e07Golgin_A5/PF09787_9/1_3e03Golgin_A5/PF09787_9/12Golgin_A5/PF09787_9/1_1e03KASH_CCD/PF14662_6/1_1e03KASH_CCD/PF14662_6/1e02KASH_CCD/PF14662_6/1_4KASH_CCD/PF14662_6/0_0014KASH